MADIKDIEVEGLITELKAAGSLGPKAEDHGYNLGLQKAIALVERYRRGRGWFQDEQ